MNERGMSIVGGSSLLTIFAILCLTVFALLALSSVQADGRLAETSDEAVSAYYEADWAAESILAKLRAGEVPAEVTDLGGHRYQYDCPISDSQTLQVEVWVEGTAYRVLRWQAVSTLDWQPEERLEVWDGNSES